jgi:hypothetical protein
MPAIRRRLIHLLPLRAISLGLPLVGGAPARRPPLPASVDEYLGGAELAGKYALGDLVRSNVRDGRMKVEVRLPPDLLKAAEKESPNTRPVRLAIDGSDLAWSLKCYGEKGPDRTVALACYDATALAPFQCVALHVGPSNIKVYAASFDMPGIQSRLEVTQGSDGISYSWLIPGQRETSGRVENIAELRKRYPTFVQTTLSAVMRRVGLRGFVRRHPAGEVYRAFPSVQPDPAAAAKVAAILPKLGSTKPREREAASDAIEEMGRPAVLAVLRLDRTTLTPEQNARLDGFLIASGEAAPDPSAHPEEDLDFLVDCLDDDELPIRQAAREALTRKLGHPLNFDITLTGDARSEAVDRLYEQIDRPRIPTTRAAGG